MGEDGASDPADREYCATIEHPECYSPETVLTTKVLAKFFGEKGTVNEQILPYVPK